jgi:hypothetical protein
VIALSTEKESPEWIPKEKASFDLEYISFYCG